MTLSPALIALCVVVGVLLLAAGVALVWLTAHPTVKFRVLTLDAIDRSWRTALQVFVAGNTGDLIPGVHLSEQVILALAAFATLYCLVTSALTVKIGPEGKIALLHLADQGTALAKEAVLAEQTAEALLPGDSVPGVLLNDLNGLIEHVQAVAGSEHTTELLSEAAAAAPLVAPGLAPAIEEATVAVIKKNAVPVDAELASRPLPGPTVIAGLGSQAATE